MLPSHPSVLPHYYDSTASTTEDDDADSERDDDDGQGSGHSRRREEARAGRRRTRGTTARSETSSSMASTVQIKPKSSPLRAPYRSGPSWEEKHHKMPVVAGREGLGFVIEGLGGADYDALVDRAASPGHRREGTYTSSLGSGISSSSPAPSPSLSRPTQRFAVTHDQAISFDEPRHPHSSRSPAPSPSLHAENRVHFEQPEQPQRARNGSMNGGYVALQPEHIVFPDFAASPVTTDSRRTSTAASTMFSDRTVAFSSPATTVESASRYASPSLSAPRARSPRLPAGPSTMVGETIAKRSASPSQLYFPGAPPKAQSLPSKSPSPSNASSVSLVFPSRIQPKPPTRAPPPAALHPSSKLYFPSPPASSPAPSPTFPSRSRQSSAQTGSGPFPTRPQQRRPSPSLPSRSPIPASPATAHFAGPFPPPPSDSPQARYLGGAPRSPLPTYDSSTPAVTISPSFASTISNLTVAEPIFPSLNAKLADDGVVRADVSNRRVSRAPWEGGAPGQGSDSSGDELDKMMRAQRRGGAGAESASRQQAKERELKRKSIHAELLKQASWPPNLAEMGPVPASPKREQDEAFHRVLLESDTVKKSLGSSLLSDSVSSRRPSPVYEEPVSPPAGGGGDDQSETSLSLENGLTASTSTTSELSLPSFPDVPAHYFPSPPRGFAAHRSSGVSSDGGERLETLAERAIDAHAHANPSGLVAAYDFADVASAVEGLKKRAMPPVFPPPATGAGRARMTSSESGLSQYADAEEIPDSPCGLQEVPVSPIALSGQVPVEYRNLGAVAEENEEVENIRGSRLYVASPTSSAPVTPLITSFPPIPTPSPGRSIYRNREASNSSIAVPPSPGGSAGSSITSSAAVSYTAPRRNAATSSANSSGYVKPAKLGFGKKFGAFFSHSTPNGSGSSTASGISSRDYAHQHSFATGSDDASASIAARQPSSDWDARTSFSASTAGVSGGMRPTPPSMSVTSSLAASEKENKPATSSASAVANDGLSDLLSRFEREEKERIARIAQGRSRSKQLRREPSKAALQASGEVVPATTGAMAPVA
ncbi:hypothetical protein JCM8097_001947 [Rhodosporidiobolus ruineniae]